MVNSSVLVKQYMRSFRGCLRLMLQRTFSCARCSSEGRREGDGMSHAVVEERRRGKSKASRTTRSETECWPWSRARGRGEAAAHIVQVQVRDVGCQHSHDYLLPPTEALLLSLPACI
ncbi:hypothetical protein DPEC_G00032270 [Dallia pectoralis]|uniref:Uncharacterized protein n=1 Tax=Dallia pectoralis TaxID=75939 RepID=A0ACC2HCI0_DALPE|nr:hypothetical protein DPEC_G00032270 [Dallia pectoralis]